MIQRTLPLLVLVGLLHVPSAAAQAPLATVALVKDDADHAVANATVLVWSPAGDQLYKNETANATGHVQFQLPAGTYKIQVFDSRNQTELWHENAFNLTKATNFTKPLGLARNQPHVPRAPTFSPAGDPNATTASTRIGNATRIHIPITYPANATGNRTIRVDVTAHAADDTLLEAWTLGSFRLAPGQRSWANATLSDTEAPIYHAAEHAVTFRATLSENATRRVFDRAPPAILLVQDACGGTLQAHTVTLNPDVNETLCLTAADIPGWDGWASEARQLQERRADWYQRLLPDAAGWDAAAALLAWTSYQADTDVLATPVIGRLDQLQTDATGAPSWSQLQNLREAVDADHDKLRALVADAVDDEIDQANAKASSATRRVALEVVAATLVFAGVGFAAAWVIVSYWKKKAEYWIGYSARGQPPDPFLATSLVILGALAIGLTAGLLMGGTDLLQLLIPGGD